MSASDSEPVAINILDREVLIACTPEERPSLLEAARYLDAKMREMRHNARSATLDRVAILAALNISHELLNERNRDSTDSAQLSEQLQAMNAKIERVVAI